MSHDFIFYSGLLSFATFLAAIIYYTNKLGREYARKRRIQAIEHATRQRELILNIEVIIRTFNEKHKYLYGNYGTYISESMRQGTYTEYTSIVSQRKRIDDKYISDELKPLFFAFDEIELLLTNYQDKLTERNKNFVKKEIEYTYEMLSNVDGRSLDDAQRTAVVTDEDANLVVAGAGSGKTLTIVGKVKYLVERKGVDPEDILMISFTRKAAEEMTERVKRIGLNVKASTFHKLGLNILKDYSYLQVDIFDEDDFSNFIKNYIKNAIAKDSETVKHFIEYFAYYLHVPPKLENFKTLGQAYEYNRNLDLETIQSKYQYVQESLKENKDEKRTLQGEHVKSIEELTIANYLFLHGIKYKYEALYPYQMETNEKKKYRPDFYLVDYDIWLEHFGINENGEAPWLPGDENLRYVKSMEWKRSWHNKYATKLIETYSWYSSKGILLIKLEELLRSNGVFIGSTDYADIFDKVYQNNDDKYYKDFIELCQTFITLFKAKGYKIEDINSLSVNGKDDYSISRCNAFKTIVKPMVIAYDKALKDSGKIDFSDMILKATDAVKNAYQVLPYKYIIVDEFQDVSMSKMALIKAIREQTKAHLFCVGDDWQSIYRFTGSDLDIFTSFGKYFGKTELMRIEKTYRNSQGLLDVTAEFIQKNPKQIKKQLVSAKTVSHSIHPVTFVMHSGNPATAIMKIISSITENFGHKTSIMFLARTNYSRKSLIKYGLFSNKYSSSKPELVYINNSEIKCYFYTAHKSKGLEADNVILLDFDNSPFGFPNQITDDPMLEMVLSDADSYPYGEERRLMYVALTRTRNKVFVVTNKNRPSLFFHDFEDALKIGTNVQTYDMDRGVGNVTVKCPKCGGSLLEREREDGSRFVGCVNYPQCGFTSDDLSVLVKPKYCHCGGLMVRKKGRYGEFYGCTGYPDCKHTERIM